MDQIVQIIAVIAKPDAAAWLAREGIPTGPDLPTRAEEQPDEDRDSS